MAQPPTLTTLCEQHFSSVLSTIAATISECRERTQELDARKAALLVELATVSDALEEMACSRQQLEKARESLIGQIYSHVDDEGAASSLVARLEVEALAPKPYAQPPAAPSATAAELKQQRRAARIEQARAKNEERRTQRLNAILPAKAEERQALMMRQVVIRGLPPGVVDEASLARVMENAFGSLPAFDPSSGRACTLVQLYAGGTYAFVSLRDVALAATATRLPEISVCGAQLMISRVHGFEDVGTAEALPVPDSLRLDDLSAALELEVAPKVPLETKLYWSLRQHPRGPKPCEKEVKESLAFFKKCEKLIGRKRLILDVCGSHGILGALFVAFGRTQKAIVLDIFRPESFTQICTAWRQWLAPQSQQLARPCERDRPIAADETVLLRADEDEHLVGEPPIAPNVAVSFELGDFHQTLPRLLESLPASEIGVVACHACTHLTDSIISMCIERGVDFAVMPCCQRDLYTQHQMALVAKSLNIKEHAAIDVSHVKRWRVVH